jgi:hypothetical protein
MMVRVKIGLAGAELPVVNVCGDREVDLRDAQSVRGDSYHYVYVYVYVYAIMIAQSLNRMSGR